VAGSGCAVQWRLPVVPGVTDTPENLGDWARLIEAWPRHRRISLLPYHRAAEAKYARLGLECRMKDTPAPGRERMAEVQRYFEERGFQVRIGG
jgi:pyruvate formate lyase activating enzyme